MDQMGLQTINTGVVIGGYDLSVVLLASLTVVLTLTTFCLFISSNSSGSKRPEQKSYKIKELFIYPVRGCGGQSVQAARVDELGLVNDSTWGVIDGNNKLVSQSDVPGLAKIEPLMTAENQLVLKVPEGLQQLPVKAASGATTKIEVDGSTKEVVDCGDEAAAWLNKALPSQAKYRLVKFSHGSSGIHIVNLASVDDLNSRLQAKGKIPVPASRFRPNVVVACKDAFCEDWWSNLNFVASFGWHAGKMVPLKVLGPIGHKIDVAIPQAGERIAAGGSEPFDTLQGFRNAKPNFTNTPAFGAEVNLASPTDTCGAEVRVGDGLEVGDWAHEPLPWAKNLQRALR